MKTDFKPKGLSVAVAAAIGSILYCEKRYSYETEGFPYTMCASMLYNLDGKRLQSSIIKRLLCMDEDEKRARVEGIFGILDSMLSLQNSKQNVFFIEIHDYSSDSVRFSTCTEDQDKVSDHHRKTSVPGIHLLKSQSHLLDIGMNKKRNSRGESRR
jgi:hypothetical protein